MSKSIEALNRIETIMPFNRENKPNYYSQFMQSETPFYEDFDLVKKDLEVLEILKRHSTILDDEDYDSNIFNGIDYEYLDQEERKVIKEWLENEYVNGSNIKAISIRKY